jgi:hypothetical protein
VFECKGRKRKNGQRERIDKRKRKGRYIVIDGEDSRLKKCGGRRTKKVKQNSVT